MYVCALRPKTLFPITLCLQPFRTNTLRPKTLVTSVHKALHPKPCVPKAPLSPEP